MKETVIETNELTKVFSLKSGRLRLPHFKAKKDFKEIIAVNHVTLKINKGELFGLIGPNGAGKTTFIKMLCTLLRSDYGEAFVCGYDVLREQTQVKNR
jgi:ABC-2 type transport system ATP-binding protein